MQPLPTLPRSLQHFSSPLYPELDSSLHRGHFDHRVEELVFCHGRDTGACDERAWRATRQGRADMCKIGAQKCRCTPQERDQAYPFHSHRDPHQIATTAHLQKREQLRLLNKLLQERVLILEASRGEGARWRRMPADRASGKEKEKTNLLTTPPL